MTYHETDSPNPQKQAERDAVAQHIERFLAGGGTIKQVDDGLQTAKITHQITITSESKRREKAKRKSPSIASEGGEE